MNFTLLFTVFNLVVLGLVGWGVAALIRKLRT
jgi:hypothetical protein